jgi:SRSO17 transposase
MSSSQTAYKPIVPIRTTQPLISAFRTKLKIGADLAIRARAAGFTFRATVADSAYGDQNGFRGELAEAGLPFVMALKPRRGTWAYGRTRTPRWTPLAPWPGAGPGIPATGTR